MKNKNAPIAIDVVLLPPKKIFDLAIRLSKKLKSPPFVLNKSNRLPHLSLFMGYIKPDNPKIAEARLSEIASKTPSLQLIGDRIYSFYDDSATNFWWDINIKASNELKKLHEEIIRSLEPITLRDGDVSKSYILNPEEKTIRPKTMEFTKNYLTKSAHKNFRPHITIGLGKKCATDQFPIKFMANRLALCQMGNYNTCRKILAEWQLLSLI